jgi:hypothetical protein
MADPTLKVDAALERLRRIMGRWPKPEEGQGVLPVAVRAGLQPLVPLAQMIVKLPLGYGKGYYLGAGYLSGSSKITASDRELATAVLRDVNTDLPDAINADQVLPRPLYAKLKERAYRLLALATDLDVTQGPLAKIGTAASSAWDPWVSRAALVELDAQVGAEGQVKAVDSPLAQKAEAALQRVLRFTRAFPRPTSTQLVKAHYVQLALDFLRPLAEQVAALPVGTKKGTIAGNGAPEALARIFSPLYLVAEALEGKPQPATGYLTGDTITEADLTTAKFILYCLDTLLPKYPVELLDPVTYDEIKRQAHRLLMIGTDLDLDTTLADKAALFWESVKEAVKDLGTGAKKGLDVLTVALVVAAAAGGVYAAKTLFGSG